MNNLPNWVYNLPWALIKKISDEFGLDHFLVAAIVMVESGGNNCATRYEPNFSYLPETKVIQAIARNNKETVNTTIGALKTSWGLMQIMGATAYLECNFEGNFTKLCEPEIGLRNGCCYLNKQLNRYKGRMGDAIASYNWGHARKTQEGLYINEEYYNKVMKYYYDFESHSKKD